MENKLKVLDLFSGIGGFSLGLERAGMQTTAFCENDKDAQAVLKKNWPHVPIWSDIKTLNKTKYSKIKPGAFDVICGGFPCQDISIAGNKKGFEDEKEVLRNFSREYKKLLERSRDSGSMPGSREDFREFCKEISEAGRTTKAKTTRSGLWKEFVRIIKEAKPRYAIIENVANLRSKGLNKIIKDLWQIGYACEWHIISARSIGAPHLRERIWIIAYPNSNGPKQDLSLQARNERESIQPGGVSKSWEVETSNTFSNFRLWKAFTSEEGSSRRWATATASLNYWSKTEPPICGVGDGIPKELDKLRKRRISQLGNAVVPQIVEFIGRAIVEHENEQSNCNST